MPAQLHLVLHGYVANTLLPSFAAMQSDTVQPTVFESADAAHDASTA
jgi:hypothetical protein